ncbi:hypothetical protein ACQ4PT_000786 [Festuca glaucescens]
MELKDLTQRIPEDALAAVLRRLPPHSLAAARCVCKRHRHPVSGKLHYLPTDEPSIVDHCNGLLLLHKAAYVVNPATRRWAPMPPAPSRLENGCPWLDAAARDHCYIMFDPALSPHYEVLRISSLPWRTTGFELQLEWPPSPFVMHVFSSTTGNWEERSFARRGDAIGTVTHLQQLEKRSVVPHLSAYWCGELYVLTQFVTRISLSNNTYQAIKLPVDVGTLDQDSSWKVRTWGLFCIV